MAAVREHVLSKVPVSEVCAKYNCAPSAVYRWQTDLLSQGAIVFEGKRPTKGDGGKVNTAAQQKIARLEATLSIREQAIAELVADNIRLKKIQNGES